MKIIITGGSGLLGQYLNIELSKTDEILTLYNSSIGNCVNYNCLKADITDKNILEETFHSFRPDVVVHTAAISRPETAMQLPYETVYGINVEATENLAKLCREYSAKIIYTSTDLVYDGETGPLHKEDLTPNPKSLYAETKLKGELKIKEVSDNYVILRTSLLYGIGLNHTTNNFHKMLINLREKKSVKLFFDQYRTPLSLIDAGRLVDQLIQRDDIRNQIFNFGGIERISRLQLGEILCEAGGFNRDLLIKTSMNENSNLPQVADVSMDISKLTSFGIIPKTIRESVKEILQTLD